jgi:hypothetical protein
LITDWDLNDIKPIHGKFTWSNKRTRVSILRRDWINF